MSALENHFSETKAQEAPSEEVITRYTGKLTKLKEDEGWGFISCKDIPFTRIFFHWSSLIQATKRFNALKKGMIVEFSTIDDPERGTRAVRVKVLD